MSPSKPTAQAVPRGRTGRANSFKPSTDVGARRKKAMSSPAKRVRKAAPRGKWSEAQLLTSEKSVLIDADLVKLLASPEAWDCLDETEKQEILALLPADTHPEAEAQQDDPNAKIPPLPASFLRYSNNWRDGIRQFQIDLQNGRYDPEWLRQAEEARKERENGDFDAFKEREFEQFWGQKQKMDMSLAAGESAKVKLSQLIDEGVVRLGDVWRFRYVYGKGDDRIFIDKEARIDDIHGAKLTFTFPTGTRTFLTSTHAETKKEESPTADSESKDQVVEQGVKIESAVETPLETVTEPTAAVEAPVLASPSPPKTSVVEEAILPQETSEPESQAQVTPRLGELSAENGSNEGAIQVVITSQTSSPKTENRSLKRPTPQPQPVSEPPAKRKRGRPRKTQPTPEQNSERETDTETRDQEIPSKTTSLQASTGISVEIFNSPNPSTQSASSEAVRSNAQKDPDLSSVTSPLTDIDMSDDDASDVDQAEIRPTQKYQAAEAPQAELSESSGERNAVVETIANESGSPPHSSQPQPTPNEIAIASPFQSPPSPQAQEQEQEQAQAQSPSNKTKSEDDTLEITIGNIRSPLNLVSHILKIDGRKPQGRTANAWKEIRCYRNNQDMGTLWDLRQAWFLKQR